MSFNPYGTEISLQPLTQSRWRSRGETSIAACSRMQMSAFASPLPIKRASLLKPWRATSTATFRRPVSSVIERKMACDFQVQHSRTFEKVYIESRKIFHALEGVIFGHKVNFHVKFQITLKSMHAYDKRSNHNESGHIDFQDLSCTLNVTSIAVLPYSGRIWKFIV